MSDDIVAGISGYNFSPEHLAPDQREPGISAFMRIKNGAEFLEATIRSHIGHFDEIVAVFNGCTDNTEAILRALANEYGSKLRLFHYLDRVHPPGSDAHKASDGSEPHSVVTYSNFALAQTRFRTVTKLDDDHLAIEPPLAQMVEAIRAGEKPKNELWAFSGLNLAPSRNGSPVPEILTDTPISGKGDIGFFDVKPESYFHHDPRFERFSKGEYRRVFKHFTYWHLKSLKQGMGFGNYELEANPDSRFARKRAEMENYQTKTLGQFRESFPAPGLAKRLSAPFRDKSRVALDQYRALKAGEPEETVTEAMARLENLTTLPR